MAQGWLTMLDSRCTPQLLGALRKEDKLVMSKLLYYALGGAAEEKLQVTHVSTLTDSFKERHQLLGCRMNITIDKVQRQDNSITDWPHWHLHPHRVG